MPGPVVLMEEVLLERLVVVFDTDTTRASRTVAALESRCISGGVTLLCIDTISDLHRQLAACEASIVFFDVRSAVSDVQARSHDTLEALDQALRTGVQDQVVYTGVTEQALVAVERGDYAFLLPPHASADEFVLALDKALERRDKYLEKPFVIKTKHHIRLVWPNRVSFVESSLRKVRIHVGDEIVEAYAKLSDLMQKLPNRFVQCHKSYVVNMGFIKELAQDHALLTTGEHVPISQQRRKPMREAFLAYIGRA